MVYYIYINKGLENEQLYPDVYIDLDQAIAMVDQLKKFDRNAQTVSTGFYRKGRYVKMYFTGPLELM